MRTSAALALVAAQLVASHATFQSFIVDGKDQGQHFAVQTPSNANFPVYKVASPSMVCNGGTPKTEFVAIKAGSEITMQWHHNDPVTTSGDADEPIAASHYGPVMVYMAKADSTNGQGAVWTKIYEDGVDSNGKWGVDRYRSNKGAITVKLPNLVDGEYLIRPEIIALHEANDLEKAQFYNGCGQLKISGGSVELPASGTDMTKAYSATDPGVKVNIYPIGSVKTYTIPGPKVWDGASSGSAPTTPTKPAASSAAPVSSAAPSKTATPVANNPAPVVTPSATPSAAPSTAPSTVPATPSNGNTGNGNTLPQTFTITQFIAWLKQQTGTKARRHARAFAL
jgi:cellulase